MASASVTFSGNGVRGVVPEGVDGTAIIDRTLLKGSSPSKYNLILQCDPGDALSCSVYVIGPSGQYAKWNDFSMPGEGETHTGIIIIPIGFDGYMVRFNRTLEPVSRGTLFFRSA